MQAPRHPDDEQTRLQILHALGILDTGPEDRFERLIRMARRMFGVPIAMVSLVDLNRQWFKACQGYESRGTARDISFCGHAILGDEIFTIEDAAQDERFHDNPLVTGAPHIRFYAGCPLRVSRGAKVGTLCIIDTQPRSLDPDDALALKDLAAMVEDELTAFAAATTDLLTRIWNRRGFLTLGQSSLDACARQGLPATLAYLDLDGFKAINDTHGHAAGDAVLQRFAEGLRHGFRSSDVFARLGGDEFVVLMPGAEPEAAQDAASRLADWLDATEASLGLPYRTAFSCGSVAHDSASGQRITDLLMQGDKAMYRRKRAGLRVAAD